MAVRIEGTVELTAPNLEPTIGAYKKLKAEIKNAKDELATLDAGTEAYTQKAAQIGNLTNQVDDLNKSISAVSGAPLENLNGGFSLLTDKVKTLDLDGVTSSFDSLWATIAANPLIAIVSGITLIIQNWEKLIQVFDVFTGKQQKASEAQKINVDRQIAASNIIIKQLERELALSIALGEAKGQQYIIEEKILQQQKQQIEGRIQLAKLIKEEELAIKNSITVTEIFQGVLEGLSFGIYQGTTDAGLVAVNAELVTLQQNLLDVENQIKVTNIKELAELLEKRKVKVADPTADEVAFLKEIGDITNEAQNKRNADAAKLEADASAKRIADFQAFLKGKQQLEYDLAVQNETLADQLQIIANEKELADTIAFLERKKEAQAKYNEDVARVRANFQKELAAEELEAEKKLAADKAKASIEGQRLATAAIGSLSGLLYNIKSKNLEKGSEAEQKAAQKAFNLEKGVQTSMAVINGVQATLAAFASGSKFGPVVGAAYATAAGIVAAANIAKIQNTKFTPSATTGTDAASEDLGSLNIPTPAPANPTAPTGGALAAFQPTTGLNPDGTPRTTPGALGVYEGDITAVQERVQVLEGRARF